LGWRICHWALALGDDSISQPKPTHFQDHAFILPKYMRILTKMILLSKELRGGIWY